MLAVRYEVTDSLLLLCKNINSYYNLLYSFVYVCIFLTDYKIVWYLGIVKYLHYFVSVVATLDVAKAV